MELPVHGPPRFHSGPRLASCLTITPSDDAEAQPTLHTTDRHIRTSCRVGIDQMTRRECVMRAAGQTSRDQDRAVFHGTPQRVCTIRSMAL